nr:hypothetical protein [Tanacetum cinerariifolium]
AQRRLVGRRRSGTRERKHARTAVVSAADTSGCRQAQHVLRRYAAIANRDGGATQVAAGVGYSQRAGYLRGGLALELLAGPALVYLHPHQQRRRRAGNGKREVTQIDVQRIGGRLRPIGTRDDIIPVQVQLHVARP